MHFIFANGIISLILRDFSLSSGAFHLEKGTLALSFDKNLKNLREVSYENMQNKPRVQVINKKAGWIELDVRLTKDQVPVVFHDHFIEDQGGLYDIESFITKVLKFGLGQLMTLIFQRNLRPREYRWGHHQQWDCCELRRKDYLDDIFPTHNSPTVCPAFLT